MFLKQRSKHLQRIQLKSTIILDRGLQPSGKNFSKVTNHNANRFICSFVLIWQVAIQLVRNQHSAYDKSQFSFWQIQMQLLTNQQKAFCKSPWSFWKSIGSFVQINNLLQENPHTAFDRSNFSLWKIHMQPLTNPHKASDKCSTVKNKSEKKKKKTEAKYLQPCIVFLQICLGAACWGSSCKAGERSNKPLGSNRHWLTIPVDWRVWHWQEQSHLQSVQS